MKELLECIASNLIWLFDKYDFRIVRSAYNSSFGGQGMIEMQNGSIELRLIKDRGQIYIELRPLQLPHWPADESITVDLLYREITGSVSDVTVVCEETVSFLKQNFDALITLFTSGDGAAIFAHFARLKSDRARRLFG